MMESRLEELFRICDPTGSGHVGKPELASLCSQFGISSSDSDAIFLDLDHDGDGSISFSEFSHGFRDFATPGSRRGSLQLPTPSSEKLDEMGRRHASAKGAWTNFSSTLGLVPESDFNEDEVGPSKNKKIEKIPEESVSKALSLLMSDVTRLTDDYKSLETSFRRSAVAHAAQLEALGEEMDQQLAKTEARAKAEAREEAAKQMDAERRKIASEMELQLSDLSEQLVSFKRAWSEGEAKRGGRDGRNDRDRNDGGGGNSCKESGSSSSGDELEFENRNLRAALLETQAKAALLQSQLVLKRNDYRDLYEELYSEKAVHRTQVEAMQDHLSSLSEANRVLCDVNDCFITSAAVSGPSSHTDSHFGDRDSGRGTLMDEIRSAEVSPSPLWAKPPAVGNISPPTSTTPTSITDKPIEDKPSCTPSSSPALERTFKVILAGDASVGKSTFIERVCHGHFTANLSSTIGVDFRVKSVNLDGASVALQLWDTAGQERFRSLTKSYFRRADGVLLLYDVSNERTFISIRHWVNSVQEGAGRNLPIVLCGNKSDLRGVNGVDCVPFEEGSKLAAQCGASFLETSPKSGENVLNSLVLLARDMSLVEDTELKNSVSLLDSPLPAKKGCCGSSSGSS